MICEFLLADRISIEAQIRTVEVALRMTMGEKVKLHELRRFIFYRIFRFIYQIQWWGQFECKWGRMGRLFFPLKFNSPNSLVSFMSFFNFLSSSLYHHNRGKSLYHEWVFFFFELFFIMVEGKEMLIVNCYNRKEVQKCWWTSLTILLHVMFLF